MHFDDNRVERIDIDATGKGYRVNPIGRDTQWPLREADYVGTLEHDQKTTISLIVARHSALDLAEGIGLLGLEPYTGFDSYDKEPW